MRSSGARVQMMLRGTQINYMPDKSHLIIIIVNEQGQVVSIYLIRKKLFNRDVAWNYGMESCCYNIISYTRAK